MFFVLLINFQISFSFVLIVLKPKCIYFLKDGTEVYFLTGLVILPEWLKSAGNLGRVKEAERPEIYKPRHGIGLGIWKGLETKSESSSFIYKHTSFWIQKFELLVYFFFSKTSKEILRYWIPYDPLWWGLHTLFFNSVNTFEIFLSKAMYFLSGFSL